jgi:hypothetical protein
MNFCVIYTDRLRPQLKFAVRPANGPREDAVIHVRLMSLDLTTVLRCRSHNPIEIFVDCDALDNLESPINLHMHHHDELVFRTEKELTRYQAIMNKPPSERARGLRSWYRETISQLEKTLLDHKHAIQDLDIDKLCETLKAAKKVRYFGGASLGLLERLIRKGVGRNIECYLQAVSADPQSLTGYSQHRQGTSDISLNQLDNQYNIALNPGAAKFVFSNYKEVSNLTLIPTDTTKRVRYSLIGLPSLSPFIARRCLAFNCHIEAMRLATGTVSVAEYPDEKVALPDLTAFLFAFTEGFESSTLEFANAVDERGQLILKDANSGIHVFKLRQDVLVEEPRDLLKLLSVYTGSACVGGKVGVVK